MLDRKFRLPASIRLKNPYTCRSASFVAKIAQNDLPYSRFGFVIKKTTEKRATARNRIRRVFRSCIEERLQQIRQGYDMLFFLEKGIIETQRDLLCVQIEKVLKERGLMQ